ncbi:MAG: hypothetical protein GY769_13645 [bacterium]|nr:hypothetical protein [bacterium]
MPPRPRRAQGAIALVGKNDCASGGFAAVVRDLRNGSLVSCASLGR